jgi:predicted sulfurtransferase
MTAGVRSKGLGRWRDEMAIVLRDAVIAAGISFAAGLLVNLARPDAIAFVADQPYELFVPCSEPGGEVTPMAADAPALLADDTFVVDARSKEEFDAWRLRRAVNISYDYLDPTPQETLQDLAETIARSRAKRVVVYGDGDTPDTGEQLAKEVSGHGIKHVFFVEGGAPELRSSERPGGRR